MFPGDVWTEIAQCLGLQLPPAASTSIEELTMFQARQAYELAIATADAEHWADYVQDLDEHEMLAHQFSMELDVLFATPDSTSS